MEKPICPTCGGIIAPEDINVEEDIAFCRACNRLHPFSQLARSVYVGDVDLEHSPRGTWFDLSGFDIVIGASHRSLRQAFGALFGMLFWNGILSVFVLLNLTATLRHMGVNVPSVSTTQPQFGSHGAGMTIFLWVFLTPFIL